MNQYANSTPPARADEDILEIDLSMLIRAVLSRWQLCAVICGGVIVLALAYCLLSTPIYMATCRMLIEPENLVARQIQGKNGVKVSMDARSRDAFMTTQIQLLTSNHLLSKVVEHFKLTEREEFSGVREPLNVLSRHVVIQRVPNTNLIDISFKSPDAAFSADVSNFIARTYIEDSSQRTNDIFQGELDKLQNELLHMEASRVKAIARLNEYKQKHNILSVDSSQTLGIARLTELDRASVSAQEERAIAQATVTAITQWREKNFSLDSFPDAIQNPTLTQFKVARLQAQASLLQAQQDFGPSHKSVETQRLVLRDMDRAIAAEAENCLVAAQVRLEQASVRIRILNEERERAAAELRQLDQITDEYRMLQDNLNASENAYQLALQNVNELRIARSAAGDTLQIVVPAVSPVKAAYPQKAKIMVIAALAAGMFSVLLCIVLELLDGRLKRREDVEKISGVPVYGFIPHADSEQDCADLTILDKPQSRLADAFRVLRTSLSLSEAGRQARIIAVTSAVSGDGKTFTSLNLAVTYARAGKRVLLMDTDLRTHRLSSLLRTPGAPDEGLSNILACEIPFERISSVLQSPLQNLPVMFLGSGPVPSNPAELLNENVLQPLMKDLLTHFDIIIMDAPSVLDVSDVRMMAAVPGLRFLAVVRMLATEKKQLAAMMDALRTVEGTVIGTVLNNANEGYGWGDTTAATASWQEQLRMRLRNLLDRLKHS